MSKGKSDTRQRRKNHQSNASQTVGQPSSHSQPIPTEANNTIRPVDRSRMRPPRRKKPESSGGLLDLNRTSTLLVMGLGVLCVLVVIVTVTVYKRVQREKVRQPLQSPRLMSINDTDMSLFWGSYRPQLYFGMRHRSPHSLLAGLIWFKQGEVPPRLRHWCDSGDQLSSYNWLLHDGRNFGKQQIIDTHHVINTTFVKRNHDKVEGGDWTARVSVSPRTKSDGSIATSILFYFMLPDSRRGTLEPLVASGEEMTGLTGETLELGKFRIAFHRSDMKTRSQKENQLVSHLGSHAPREDRIQEAIVRGMGMAGNQRIALVGRLPLTGDEAGAGAEENLWVYQLSGVGEFSLEVVFESVPDDGKGLRKRAPPMVGAVMDAQLAGLTKAFDSKFDLAFPMDKKKYSDKQLSLSKSVLSNMLGGMGYFYGASLIISEYTAPDPVHYWDAPLFSATPSRPQFPRGFLWDEGFHNLLVGRWDPQLALESIGYWLDMMNAEGWIPREQILGWEARAKVPQEFVIQNNQFGNPPTLILALEDILDRFSGSELGKYRDFLERAFPRLEAWFNWFNTTQLGLESTAYRWKGRKETAKQLNPLTLTSGLDDYPRSSHPSPQERHLDLRCWMATFSRVMARLAQLCTSPTSSAPCSPRALERYTTWADMLTDEKRLDQLHWSETKRQYADFGHHTDRISLVTPVSSSGKRSNPNQPPEQMEKVRHVLEEPRPQLLHWFGYVSLFPLLLRLLPPDSPRLGRLLEDLAEERLLWTRHGLRSLSRVAPLYARHNTEHDPPYWRGAIWINMNYLAVRALRHYAALEGPYRQHAGQLQARLRDNLVTTVIGEFDRTGYLWEQYDDTSGRGQRAHPFSGWTALVTLIMADG